VRRVRRGESRGACARGEARWLSMVVWTPWRRPPGVSQLGLIPAVACGHQTRHRFTWNGHAGSRHGWWCGGGAQRRQHGRGSAHQRERAATPPGATGSEPQAPADGALHALDSGRACCHQSVRPSRDRMGRFFGRSARQRSRAWLGWHDVVGRCESRDRTPHAQLGALALATLVTRYGGAFVQAAPVRGVQTLLDGGVSGPMSSDVSRGTKGSS